MASAAARVSKARGAGAGERIREREMVCIVVKDGRSGRMAGRRERRRWRETAAARGERAGDELGETAAEWIGLGGERRGVQGYRASSVRPEAGPKNFPPQPKFFSPSPFRFQIQYVTKTCNLGLI